MTLQDKFYNIGYNEYGFDYDECEKIADNYAIGFAEWLVIRKVRFFDDTDQGMLFTVDLYKTKYTTKELLEIYKIEKGL